MIVDNLGKERRRLGEYLPEVFETCLANFLYYLLLVYSFYMCFLWEKTPLSLLIIIRQVIFKI